MNSPILWVKFYKTGSPEVITFYTENNYLQNDGETHDFTSAEDAVNRSTTQAFIFWDAQPIGSGKLPENEGDKQEVVETV